MRGIDLPGDILILAGECHANDPVMLMADKPISRDNIRRLQKRFVQVRN